jgi:hypothetical protein
VTITHDHAARRHSYDLIASAFELGDRARSSDSASRATQAA